MSHQNNVQEQEAFATLHGCLPPHSEFKHQWPWALDLIKRHVATVLTDHALALQVEFTEILGINFAAYMFGCVGYFTLDPRNIEAITNSRFQGTSNFFLEFARFWSLRKNIRHMSRLSSSCLLSIAWRRHLHAGWSAMEAFTGNAPSTVCTSSGKRPRNVHRAGRDSDINLSQLQRRREPPTCIFPLHPCNDYDIAFRRIHRDTV